jgi:hypothetical protein
MLLGLLLRLGLLLAPLLDPLQDGLGVLQVAVAGRVLLQGQQRLLQYILGLHHSTAKRTALSRPHAIRPPQADHEQYARHIGASAWAVIRHFLATPQLTWTVLSTRDIALTC